MHLSPEMHRVIDLFFHYVSCTQPTCWAACIWRSLIRWYTAAGTSSCKPTGLNIICQKLKSLQWSWRSQQSDWRCGCIIRISYVKNWLNWGFLTFTNIRNIQLSSMHQHYTFQRHNCLCHYGIMQTCCCRNRINDYWILITDRNLSNHSNQESRNVSLGKVNS